MSQTSLFVVPVDAFFDIRAFLVYQFHVHFLLAAVLEELLDDASLELIFDVQLYCYHYPSSIHSLSPIYY